MSGEETEVVRAMQTELLAIGARMQTLMSGDPRIPNDPVRFAWGQLNSAVRFLEVAILKAGGAASTPPVIG